MRIVHIISSLKMGGAETVLVSLLTHPLFASDEHHVIYFHDGPLATKLRIPHVTLHHIPYGPLFLISVILRVRSIRPDSIHGLLWFAIVCSTITSALLRIPSVGVFHNNIDQNSGYKNYIDWFMLRFVTKRVAVSEAVADSVCAYHRWCDRASIAVIHNGIDMPRDSLVPSARAQYAIPGDALVLGTVGRFEAVKRYPWLIDRFERVARQYPQLYLVLIGVGSQEQQLRQLVARKGLDARVRFIVGADAQTIYPLFDIFTLTSEKEGISLALLEAMSHELPTVVTHTGGEHPVLTDRQEGFVISADQQELYEQRLGTLIDDAALRTAMGSAGKKTVEAVFSRNEMVRQYKELFTALGTY
jgi:glycosyltransferase involved in cell wall biosynthesis